MKYKLGIDVGGTFTDFILISEAGGTTIHKTLSTPEDPSIGVLTGIHDEDWAKIRQMAIEVHTNIPGGQNLVEDITALLQPKGFTVTVDYDSRFSPVGVHMMYVKRP